MEYPVKCSFCGCIDSWGNMAYNEKDNTMECYECFKKREIMEDINKENSLFNYLNR